MMMNLNMSFFQAAGKASVPSLFLVPDFHPVRRAPPMRAEPVHTVISGHMVYQPGQLWGLASLTL